MPTITMNKSPPTSMVVQTRLAHIDSRMPQKLTRVMNSRNPTISSGNGAAGRKLCSALENALVLAAMLVHLSASALLVAHAARSRRPEAVVLAACLLLSAGIDIHDTLVYLRVLPGNGYYLALSSCATLLGVSFALTWRMVQGMRLVEQFNAVLQSRVDEASQRLAEGLRRQHDAQLEQTRLAERLNLVRDLHDGLGMTINSHIQALQGDAGTRQAPALWALREVSETTVRQQAPKGSAIRKPREASGGRGTSRKRSTLAPGGDSGSRAKRRRTAEKTIADSHSKVC